MPFSGPETVIPAPPLVSPPTGLLQSVQVIEHPLLQSTGNLAYLVGPDAPDTVLASAIGLAIAQLWPNAAPGLLIEEVNEQDHSRRAIALDPKADLATYGKSDGLHAFVAAASYASRELIRDHTAWLLQQFEDSDEFVPMGGMELGGDGSDADPFDHWGAGIRWLPENALPAEVQDPCTDGGTVFSTLDGGRTVADAITNTDTSLVSVTAMFTAADVGKTVTGAGTHASDIPANTTIASVTSLTTVVLNQATVGSHTGVQIVIAPASTGVSRKTPVAGQPFLAVVHDSCSTFGWEVADYVGRATRGLLPKETWAVEHEFMHGRLMGAARAYSDGATNTDTSLTSATAGFTPDDIGKVVTGTGAHAADIAAGTTIVSVTSATVVVLSQATGGTHTGVGFTIGSIAGGSNRYLSDNHCHVYTLGAVSPTPIAGLAYANEAIAKANIGQGMIHVSAYFVEAAQSLGYSFMKDARGRLVTLNGNIVVPGNGYDGIGPDGTGGSADDVLAGHDSGHQYEWIYVTDIPVVWREPQPMIFPAALREATYRDLNEVTFRAQREVIVAWSALLQIAIKCKLY